MAHKKVLAIFNDFAAAENASYQVGKRHIDVSDMAFYQKELYENEVEDDLLTEDKYSLIVGYNNNMQMTEETTMSIAGLKVLPDCYATNTKERRLINKYSTEVAEGQIIWTVKVNSGNTNQVCDILDHCGAVLIEKL